MTGWDTAGLVGVAAGVLGTVLAYVRGSRSDRVTSILAATQLRMEALNRLIDQQQEEIESLRGEVVRLRARIAGLESRLHD